MTATMIDVDGGTVWADDSGGDGPPLVLLHPGVGDSRIWDRVLPALVLQTGDLEQEDPPVFGRLGEISVPVSLLVGDADYPPLIEADKAAAARIPGCELILVPGLDHLPPLRDPDLVLRTITGTLARAPWSPEDQSQLLRYPERTLASRHPLRLPAIGVESGVGAEPRVRSDNWFCWF